MYRVLVMLGIAACAGDPYAPYVDGPCTIPQTYPLEDSAVRHACAHVDEGPHATREAAATREEAPALTAPHTAYFVTLPELGSGRSGLLSFTAPSAGAWSFFADGQTPFAAVGQDGARRCPATRLGLGVCAALRIAEVHDVDEGEALWLAFGPGDPERATVVLERY